MRGSGRFKAASTSSRLDDVGFNPLHCGAVVASVGVGVGVNFTPFVSIPFIAGQWSLHPNVVGITDTPIILFQSPSLRGSGRFICVVFLTVRCS